MKRIILFSQPTERNLSVLSEKLFPKELGDKVFAYMPANGHLTAQKYTDFWKEIANKNEAEFIFIDNMEKGEEVKLGRANVLMITGGNTFELLNNLRNSGLDRAVIEFSKKESYVLAGFSAGAIVLGPKIDIAKQPSGVDPTDMVDENLVGLTDLTGLKILDFEVWPHFYEKNDIKTVTEYRWNTDHEVKTIRDDELVVIEK